MTEQELFVAALDRPEPVERRQFLLTQCGGDAGQVGRIEHLLGLVGEIGPFLDTPAGHPDTLVAPDAVSRATSGAGVGTVVAARYELLRVLGEGGMGIVWLAEQRQPVHRRVALKLLKPGMDSRQVVARFEAERQALALMDHLNIARVFDGGATADDRPYFVLEMVDGPVVTRYCDGRGLGIRPRLELFTAVCQAIQHAHQKGVIHRDIKPSNILVAEADGQPVPKVIDFGVAKAVGEPLGEHTLHTGLGTIIGTPEYMSPEQAELTNHDIDTRADIYALGVLLYELLTGASPLDRARLKAVPLLEVLRLVREEEPPRPSSRLSPFCSVAPGPQVRELDWVVLKCLEKDRARRYETVDGLAHDVKRFLNDEPIQAHPPSRGYRLRKAIRRNRVAVLAAAVLGLVLVTGAAVSTTLAIRATRAEQLAGQRLENETAERGRAEAAERERKRQLVGARLAQARAGRHGHQPGHKAEGLRVLAEAAGLARELRLDEGEFRALRDEMAAYLALDDVRVLHEWPGLPPGSTDRVGFDADLGCYARSDYFGNIEVRQVEGDRLLGRLPGEGGGEVGSGAILLRFSPDGRYLAVTNRHHLRGRPANFQVWDWAAGRVVLEPPLAAAACFSADGRQLAVSLADRSVAVYETAGWTQTARLPTGFHARGLAFHPDGVRLAVAGAPGAVVPVWDVTSGETVLRVSIPPSEDNGSRTAHCVAWNPAGTLLTAGGEAKNVCLWDAATGNLHAILRGHHNTVIGVQFVPGAELLVSTAWDNSTRLWNPWTCHELVQFAGFTHHVSRDGRRLATLAGESLMLREVDPARGCVVLPHRPGIDRRGPGGWDVSRDGRWLAAPGSPIRLWDLARGEEVGPPTGPACRGLRFHPNGRELFTSGSDGAFRWSFEPAGGLVRVRPTERILGPARLEHLGLDRDGGRLVVAAPLGSVSVDLRGERGPPLTLEHRDAVTATVSPDGHWAATATFHGAGVRVWDARTGHLEETLMRHARITRAAFSPDGRWLVTSTGSEFTVWEVGTWRRAWATAPDHAGDIPGPMAFSPDGTVLALAVSPTTVQLIEPGTWRTLARLQKPDGILINCVAFTPDNTRLILSTDAQLLWSWELRRVRATLAESGLDWDAPVSPAPTAGNPVRMEFDLAAYNRLAKSDDGSR